MRFLISRLSSLGDVTCCLPAAAALKKSYNECHITWIVDPRFAGVVECCSAVDLVVDAASVPLKDEFDVAMDLQGLLKSAWPLAKTKAKAKLGYHWQREGSWLFSQRVLPDPSSFHIVDQYVDVARAAGGDAHRANFSLKADPVSLASIGAKLGTLTKFVVVNPGAAWATKRWPPEHFAVVIDGLAESGVGTVLIGGKAGADKQSAADVLLRCSSKPTNLVGETNIKELIALLSLSAAHLGGDTGSTHLAAGLDKPAVGLYSITRPERSCPYGQIERCHYDPGGLSNVQPGPVLDTMLEAVA